MSYHKLVTDKVETASFSLTIWGAKFDFSLWKQGRFVVCELAQVAANPTTAVQQELQSGTPIPIGFRPISTASQTVAGFHFRSNGVVLVTTGTGNSLWNGSVTWITP